MGNLYTSPLGRNRGYSYSPYDRPEDYDFEGLFDRASEPVDLGGPPQGSSRPPARLLGEGPTEPRADRGGADVAGPDSDVPSVVNYGNKTNINTPLGKVAARDLALSPFPTTMQKGIGMAADALAGALGPYGVVGGPQAPEVGTQAFAQQTPALDTAPGVPDPGHQAASMSATGNPAGVAGTAVGGLGGTASNPSVPGSFGGRPGNPGASVSSAGHNATGVATSDVGTPSAGVAGNVGAGNMGGGGNGGAAGGGNSGSGPGGTSGTGMGGSASGGVL